MAVLDFKGVELDYCLTCGGSWLDRGEMGLLLEGKLDVDYQRYLAGSGSPTARPCPVCTKPMRESAFRGTDILVDACTLGHGLWLDRGELRRIIRTGAHRERVPALAGFYEALLDTETQTRRSP
jgi:hypothetical protein